MQLSNQSEAANDNNVIYLQSVRPEDLLYIQNLEALIANGTRSDIVEQLAAYSTFNGEAINRIAPNSSYAQEEFGQEEVADQRMAA